VSESSQGSGGTTYPRTAQASGTQFTNAPGSVVGNDGTSTLWTESLPPGARSIYEASGQSAVAILYVGAGRIIFLGWDWFDAAPRGTQDGGWLAVLNSALLERSPLALFIAHQPTDVTIVPDPPTSTQTTSNATFAVVAAGTGPLRYQWTFWGTNLPGAMGAALTISNVSLDNAGPYAVRVSDTNTTVTSSNADLRLLVKPTITVPIQAQSVVSNGSVSFSVWAVPVHSTLPMTYRWLRGGLYVVTNDQPTLLVSHVTNSSTYQVVVVSPGGTDFKPPVVLLVWADADHDGLPDRWMTNYFGHTNGLAADLSGPQDDADGDGATNLEEYQAGTNPTNALSVFKLMFPPNPLATGPWRFYFTAITNRTYSVEFRDGLSPTNWSNLLSLDSLPTNRTVWITNVLPQATSNRIYRAKTPRNF
jgi:hypothetical protein